MGFFNAEKGKTQAFKAELASKTNEELEAIVKSEVKTSFFGFSSGNEKQRQVAAFELLRERKSQKTKKCPFCLENIPLEAKSCKFCGKEVEG